MIPVAGPAGHRDLLRLRGGEVGAHRHGRCGESRGGGGAADAESGWTDQSLAGPGPGSSIWKGFFDEA